MEVKRFLTAVSFSSLHSGLFANVIAHTSPRLSPCVSLTFASIFSLQAVTFYQDKAPEQLGHLLGMALNTITTLAMCDSDIKPCYAFLAAPLLISASFAMLGQAYNTNENEADARMRLR